MKNCITQARPNFFSYKFGVEGAHKFARISANAGGPKNARLQYFGNFKSFMAPLARIVGAADGLAIGLNR